MGWATGQSSVQPCRARENEFTISTIVDAVEAYWIRPSDRSDWVAIRVHWSRDSPRPFGLMAGNLAGEGSGWRSLKSFDSFSSAGYPRADVQDAQGAVRGKSLKLVDIYVRAHII
jgi:hypothetical protein